MEVKTYLIAVTVAMPGGDGPEVAPLKGVTERIVTALQDSLSNLYEGPPGVVDVHILDQQQIARVFTHREGAKLESPLLPDNPWEFGSGNTNVSYRWPQPCINCGQTNMGAELIDRQGPDDYMGLMPGGE